MTRGPCDCAVPLIAGTANTITIDGVELDNRPPVCVRCYVQDREVGRAAEARAS